MLYEIKKQQNSLTNLQLHLQAHSKSSKAAFISSISSINLFIHGQPIISKYVQYSRFDSPQTAPPSRNLACTSTLGTKTEACPPRRSLLRRTWSVCQSLFAPPHLVLFLSSTSSHQASSILPGCMLYLLSFPLPSRKLSPSLTKLQVSLCLAAEVDRPHRTTQLSIQRNTQATGLFGRGRRRRRTLITLELGCWDMPRYSLHLIQAQGKRKGRRKPNKPKPREF
jgi:hypothetical protein